MTKIYWFKRRNSQTGAVTDEVFDSSEDIAWNYYKDQRNFAYVGWSDGRFIKEAEKQIVRPKADSRGLMMQPVKKTRELLLQARDKEIEFAINNSDKLPPKDNSRVTMASITE